MIGIALREASGETKDIKRERDRESLHNDQKEVKSIVEARKVSGTKRLYS